MGGLLDWKRTPTRNTGLLLKSRLRSREIELELIVITILIAIFVSFLSLPPGEDVATTATTIEDALAHRLCAGPVQRAQPATEDDDDGMGDQESCSAFQTHGHTTSTTFRTWTPTKSKETINSCCPCCCCHSTSAEELIEAPTPEAAAVVATTPTTSSTALIGLQVAVVRRRRLLLLQHAMGGGEKQGTVEEEEEQLREDVETIDLIQIPALEATTTTTAAAAATETDAKEETVHDRSCNRISELAAVAAADDQRLLRLQTTNSALQEEADEEQEHPEWERPSNNGTRIMTNTPPPATGAATGSRAAPGAAEEAGAPTETTAAASHPPTINRINNQLDSEAAADPSCCWSKFRRISQFEAPHAPPELRDEQEEQNEDTACEVEASVIKRVNQKDCYAPRISTTTRATTSSSGGVLLTALAFVLVLSTRSTRTVWADTSLGETGRVN